MFRDSSQQWEVFFYPVNTITKKTYTEKIVDSKMKNKGIIVKILKPYTEKIVDDEMKNKSKNLEN